MIFWFCWLGWRLEQAKGTETNLKDYQFLVFGCYTNSKEKKIFSLSGSGKKIIQNMFGSTFFWSLSLRKRNSSTWVTVRKLQNVAFWNMWALLQLKFGKDAKKKKKTSSFYLYFCFYLTLCIHLIIFSLFIMSLCSFWNKNCRV